MSPRKHPTTDLSLRECCRELAISYATGKNWLRLGKLIPDEVQDGIPYFHADTVRKMCEELSAGRNPALKSRRNKRYISGIRIPESYVAGNSPNVEMLRTWLSEEQPSEARIRQILADSARLLAAQRAAACPVGSRQEALMKQLIAELRGSDPAAAGSTPLRLPSWQYIDGEDTLGLIYLSIRHLNARKNTGAYYTPELLVRRLLEDMFFDSPGRGTAGDPPCKDPGPRHGAGDFPDPRCGSGSVPDPCCGSGSVLDPCCGSGTFLLHLPYEIPLSRVYGMDLDPIAIAITRINLAMRTGTGDCELLHTHFQVGDFLRDLPNDAFFDRILGNPPWGSHYSHEEKAALRALFSWGSGALESSDLFVAQALRHLTPGGEFAFLLPEAMLTVSVHRGIRRALRRCGQIRHLDLLGEAFSGVQCPSMILHFHMDGTCLSSAGTNVCLCTGEKIRTDAESVDTAGEKGENRRDPDERKYIIRETQSLGEDELLLPIPDEDYRILRKLETMPGAVTLKGHADFALGIVTGDNRKYVRERGAGGGVPSSGNAAISEDTPAVWEPVLRGSDLLPYVFRAPSRELDFRPEHFQQIADVDFYRAPEKLLYRFIRSDLVVSYDDRQTLTLNSANILIPRLPGYSVKTVLALLNAPPSSFWFRRRFRSVKVLRSHLESIPLPPVDSQTGQEIDTLVDEILAAAFCSKKQEHSIRKLQRVMKKLYPLTEEEYDRIEV